MPPSPAPSLLTRLARALGWLALGIATELGGWVLAIALIILALLAIGTGHGYLIFTLVIIGLIMLLAWVLIRMTRPPTLESTPHLRRRRALIIATIAGLACIAIAAATYLSLRDANG